MIIGICGEMGAGKTTLAKCIANNHNYKILSFAGRFKNALCSLFNWDMDLMHSYEYKAGVDPITGMTRRELMQKFATDYIREQVDPIFHTKITALDTLGTLNHSLVVFDDVRHPDEVEFIRSVGGVIIRIDRSDNPYPQSTHKSEMYELYTDYCLLNNGNIGMMYDKLMRNTRFIPITDQHHLDSIDRSVVLVKKYINGWYHHD